MSTYRLIIEADTEKAKKDLREVDKVADTVAQKKRKFDFQFPSTEQVAKGFSNIGKFSVEATKSVGMLYKVLRDMSPLSDGLQPLEAILVRVGRASVTAAQMMGAFINTSSAMRTVFGATSGAVSVLVERLAVLGFALQGFKGILAPLQQAFGGFFNATIGRAAAFRNTILQTQTTLASTSKVFAGSREITDPFEKIQVLTSSIEKNIDNIRKRALELSGVTSSDVVQVFNIVASQISAIGGNLKDAEDLAISFSAALGTMGIPIEMAGEEIRSLMQGTIGPDSLLARALGIRSADIERAKTQAGGVIAFIQKKLEAAVAGQKIAAQGLDGVLSNIRDIQELVGQYFGEGLLKPLVDALTVVYNKLSSISDTLYNIAAISGRTIGNILRIFSFTISGTKQDEKEGQDASSSAKNPITQAYKRFVNDSDNIKDKRTGSNVNTAEAIRLASSLEVLASKALSTLGRLAQETTNNIGRAVEALRPTIDLLIDTVIKIAAAFAKIKIAQFEGVVRMLDNIAYAMSGLISLALEFINLWYSFKNLPIVADFARLKIQLDLFKNFGGDIIINFAKLATFVVSVAIPAVKSFDVAVQGIWANVKAGTSSAIAFLTSAVANAKAVLLSLVAAFKSVVAAVVQFVIQLRGLGAVFTSVFGLLGPKVQAAILQILAPFKTLAVSIVASLQQANVQLAPVIDQIKVQLAELGVSAKKAAADVRNLNIGFGSLGAGLKGLGGMLLSSIAGFVAFEAAFALLLEGFNRYQKAQDDAKNKRDVQNALKDIAKYSGEAGKNMSALEKATLDVKKALVETRFNQLVEASVELESKIKKFQESGGGLKGLLTEDLSDMVARIFSNTFRGFGGGILGDGLFGRAELYGDDLRNKQKANQEELKALQDARDKQAKEQARIEADSPAGRLRAFQTELDLRNAQRNVTEQLNNLDIARGRLAGTLSDRRAEELQRLQEIASVSAQIKDKQELFEKKDTFNLDTKQVEQLKAEIAALETKGIQLRVDLQRSAVDKFIEDMQTNLQLSQQYQENAIARAVVEGQITPELASQLEITRQLGEVNKQILIARQELALKSTIFAADSNELKQIKNELASLEEQQINITARLQKEEFDKGLREIQIQAAAVERSLQFKSTLVTQQSNLAQAAASAAKAELGYMSTMLDIVEKMEAANNNGVVSDQTRYTLAERRLEIAISQAEVEYRMALASIRAAIQQANIDRQRAILKTAEVSAELKLAAAKKQSTVQYEAALAAAQGTVEIADQILGTTYQIAEYQEQAASYSRAAAIESAKAAYSQEKIAIATDRAQRNSQGLANNMRDAASSAGSYASNLQSAGSSGSGGGGYGGGMGGGDMSDIVPEYRDTVRSYGGVEGFKRAYGFDPTQSARDEADRKAKEFNEKFAQPNNAFFQFAGVGRAVEGIDPKLKSALIQEWQKIASGLNDAVNSFVPFGQQPLRREVDQFYRGEVGRNEFITQEGNKRFANRFASSEERQYLNTAFALAEDNIINGPKRARVAEAQRIGATFAQFSTSAAQAAQQVLSAGIPRFALGGVVDKPTIALLAEAGEREFVIPESRMAATAARYLSNYTSGEASSTNAPAINITTGPVLEFEGNRYVTMDDFERGLRSTAEGVIGRLRTPSARIALGLR